MYSAVALTLMCPVRNNGAPAPSSHPRIASTQLSQFWQEVLITGQPSQMLERSSKGLEVGSGPKIESAPTTAFAYKI